MGRDILLLGLSLTWCLVILVATLFVLFAR
jgi:hypothetical protein